MNDNTTVSVFTDSNESTTETTVSPGKAMFQAYAGDLYEEVATLLGAIEHGDKTTLTALSEAVGQSVELVKVAVHAFIENEGAGDYVIKSKAESGRSAGIYRGTPVRKDSLSAAEKARNVKIANARNAFKAAGIEGSELLQRVAAFTATLDAKPVRVRKGSIANA